MTVKMGEKIMWSTFTGRLTELELKNPPWDFHGLKNTCSFTCKPTTKIIESCVYFTEFFGFRFLTRVPMGNYLPVWALKKTMRSAINGNYCTLHAMWKLEGVLLQCVTCTPRHDWHQIEWNFHISPPYIIDFIVDDDKIQRWYFFGTLWLPKFIWDYFLVFVLFFLGGGVHLV